MNKEISNQLTDLRKEIDQLDSQILELLAERLNIARQVVETKDASGMDIRDTSREGDIIRQRILEGAQLHLESHFVTRVFHELLAESNRAQHDLLQHKLNGFPARSSRIRATRPSTRLR
jgi:chorismate mutase/prephenate dehydratase